ncbi:DUF1857-domain-containing protein [Lizonia empirigonia]|nr:DUF1857-domain-containing protein [Lizonia empirigonia]
MPPTIHHAHTTPLNPPSASPALTRAHAWAGLQAKVRRAQDFVPVIAQCRVVEERADGAVVRDVVFRPEGEEEGGEGRCVREVVREGGCWIDFEQEDGSHIRNVLSEGPGGAEDLYLTYLFEVRLPGVVEGSDEYEREVRRVKGMAKMAVEKSIETIRDMVRDGRIGG